MVGNNLLNLKFTIFLLWFFLLFFTFLIWPIEFLKIFIDVGIASFTTQTFQFFSSRVCPNAVWLSLTKLPYDLHPILEVCFCKLDGGEFIKLLRLSKPYFIFQLDPQIIRSGTNSRERAIPVKSCLNVVCLIWHGRRVSEIIHVYSTLRPSFYRHKLLSLLKTLGLFGLGVYHLYVLASSTSCIITTTI